MKLIGFVTSIFSTQASNRRTDQPVEPVNVNKPVTINEGETSTQHRFSQQPEDKTAAREKGKDTEGPPGSEMRKGGIDIKV